MWHTLGIESVLDNLRSSHRGLSNEEAARRLIEHGPNELQASKPISPWRVLLQQFKNIFVIILLPAMGLLFFLGHGIEAVAITPQSWNRYSYVENDSVGFVAPTGLFRAIMPPPLEGACWRKLYKREAKRLSCEVVRAKIYSANAPNMS